MNHILNKSSTHSKMIRYCSPGFLVDQTETNKQLFFQQDVMMEIKGLYEFVICLKDQPRLGLKIPFNLLKRASQWGALSKWTNQALKLSQPLQCPIFLQLQRHSLNAGIGIILGFLFAYINISINMSLCIKISVIRGI